MSKMTRRSFVGSSAATAGALGLGLTTANRVRGANNDLRVGVVGIRARGGTHINWAEAVDGVRVTALCDVDSQALDKKVKYAKDKYQRTVERATDFRRLLDNKDIDAISIATPNHTHSLIAIWAMQAGKDVYVEKPVSHNVWEGRQVVKHARKLGKICQTGTQSRSNPGTKAIRDFIQGGKLGKPLYAVGTCYKSRSSIGKLDKPMQVPDHIDYDLWCGPRPKKALYRKSLHYDWHWDFNTGNGDLGNQGIHQMDLARWFLGYDALSPKVMSVGGRLGYEDAGNTANTHFIIHDYEPAPLIFEVRGLPKSADKLKKGRWGNGDMESYQRDDMKAIKKYGPRIGVIVFCENGYVSNGSYHSGRAYDYKGELVQSFSGGGDHYQNFADAVRKRDHKILTADIEEGHLSSALCHTGNISYQLGKKATKGQIAESLKGHKAGMDSLARVEEHLNRLEIKIDTPTLTLGPWLEMDPKTERFTNNEEANKMLKGTYRAPFTIEELA